MTILLRITQAADVPTLARAVYQALITADCPDLASEAACMVSQARDGAEYLAAVLRLSDELQIEWAEANR